LAILAAVTGWQDGAGGLTLALRRSLAGFEARLFLSACIIISLLPLPGVRELDGLFLVVLDDEAALLAATDRFREHRSLGEYRMLTLSPGSFVAQEDGSFVYQPRLREAM